MLIQKKDRLQKASTYSYYFWHFFSAMIVIFVLGVLFFEKTFNHPNSYYLISIFYGFILCSKIYDNEPNWLCALRKNFLLGLEPFGPNLLWENFKKSSTSPPPKKKLHSLLFNWGRNVLSSNYLFLLPKVYAEKRGHSLLMVFQWLLLMRFCLQIKAKTVIMEFSQNSN